MHPAALSSDSQTRFLRANEVCARLGIKKTKLYALLAEGFPMPAKIGKASVWAEAEIEAYMAERLAARLIRGAT